ncbi:ABC transporter permease [Wohlfahrtiimonas chitiniclastica]|uniref:ABC transporter permease n=1 Tax=Wohlfahrtiimonas chitiniclastica TaxID=400946 RepID=UPI000B9903D8|nr:ABC transporter permease [Wohlfahrtiimonas chitiniclastica]OYQ76668.1 ABC transporter permease [Wohlfahrtiimonas chitiniclastica]OYQ79915.1 ABC transporter permease [Wohlfahrtiimonas chitiniclastica]
MKKHPIILNLIGLLILLSAWSLGIALLAERIPLAKLLAPTPTFAHLYDLLIHNIMTEHIAASMMRVAVSLLLALMIGVPIGILIGQSKWLESMSSGAFQLLRMISPLSWMPIVVMLLGIGNAPIFFLLTFSAIWPIILSTIAGIKSINPSWLQLGQSLSATRIEMLKHIIFPAILSAVLNGLRLAIGVVWIVLVPCEMLGVNEGLGYFILDTRDRLAYSELMAAIVLIGFIGWALDALARAFRQDWLK